MILLSKAYLYIYIGMQVYLQCIILHLQSFILSLTCFCVHPKTTVSPNRQRAELPGSDPDPDPPKGTPSQMCIPTAIKKGAPLDSNKFLECYPKYCDWSKMFPTIIRTVVVGEVRIPRLLSELSGLIKRLHSRWEANYEPSNRRSWAGRIISQSPRYCGKIPVLSEPICAFVVAWWVGRIMIENDSIQNIHRLVPLKRPHAASR